MGMIQKYLIKAGRNGMAQLSIDSGLSISTLRKTLSGHIPLGDNTYRLALACGCTEEEALNLAKECPSKTARETA